MLVTVKFAYRRSNMKFNEDFTITDYTYDIKFYDVSISPCTISVRSYALGRALKSEEIFEDTELMELINQYLFYLMETQADGKEM